MVDLEAHCFPPATISDEAGATSEGVSPFLMTLEPSSCVSDASYTVDLGGPVFLWLLTVL